MYKINALLYDNPLTDTTNDYFAKVKPAGTITNESLAQQMLEEGIELQYETIMDILRRADRLKVQLLAKGYVVNTPVCSARLSISGKFKGPTAVYNRDHHKLNGAFVAGKALRESLAEVDVCVLGVASVDPLIGEVQDALSGAVNSTLTANNAIQIRGQRIKISGDDPACGLWLIHSGNAKRVKCEQLIHNAPKALIAMVPSLPSGDYQLEIITQYVKGKNNLKEPRSVCFDRLLTIE
ncbi:MAG: DUF4469 domain-containing protein [Marinilabiliaceae bacterium]|nr:DUF4469 domain-containing protein [Marinilabiliaceae bacterium]